MEIDIVCPVSDEVLFSHVRENSAACRKWVKRLPVHDGHAVLVGGGPSLRNKIEVIRKRHLSGQKVFALNGACGFLNRNGIIPDYQVVLDAQEFMPEYLGNANDYLIASQCHPSVLKMVPDAILWHLAVDGIEDHIPAYGADYSLTGGGVTVGLSAMPLAYALGYRKMHLYGYDSSVDEMGDHAYPNPKSGNSFDTPPIASVTIGGKKFRTTLGMARQAQIFPNLVNDMIDLGCLITVDASGLIVAVMEEMRRFPVEEAA